MTEPEPSVEEPGASLPTRRERDIADAVVMRYARPTIIARARPDDLNAEAYARSIGGWGNHSAYLGARWETLVNAWAAALVSTSQVFHETNYVVTAAIPLDANADLRKELSRMGLSCPDLILAGRRDDGSTVLLPVDSKVSLDTASVDQVQALRVQELVTHGGPLLLAALSAGLDFDRSVTELGDQSRRGLQGLLSGGSLAVSGGVFAAPASGFNRGHPASAANFKRRRPLTADDVRLIEVEEESYLGGLPGRPESLVIRELDNLPATPLPDLSIAERYYRLGAGVVGALEGIESPLFGEAPMIDTIRSLRKRLQGGRVRSSVALLTILATELAARRDPLDAKKRLERFPLSFREVLARAQRYLASTPASSPEFKRILESLREQHRAEVDARGLRMMQAGLSEAETLAQLEREQPTFDQAASRKLDEALRAWSRSAPTI